MYSRIFTLVCLLLVSAGMAGGQGCLIEIVWYDDDYGDPEPAISDSCTGGIPVPDGAATVSLFWDVDSDGPDSTDPLMPLCPPLPPNPPGCVSLNSFLINGEEQGAGSGYFVSPTFIIFPPPLPVPPLAYLRVCLPHVRWESNVGTLAPGIYEWAPDSDIPLSFTCNSSPCSTQSSSGDDPPAHPSAFRLEAAYPNPFNSETVIRYELPRAEKVRLAVFDLTGRVVGVLIDEMSAAGNHEVTFRGEDLPSGVYFVRLEAGEFRQTQKLMLLR